MYKIMPSANRNNFIPSFLILMPLICFSCLIAQGFLRLMLGTETLTSATLFLPEQAQVQSRSKGWGNRLLLCGRILRVM